MKLLLVAACLFLTVTGTMAQKNYLEDSLKRSFAAARTDAEKLYALTELSTYFTGVDPKLSDDYAAQAMEIAELSRDRKLIALTHLRNGQRHLNMASLEGKIMLAMQDYQAAEKVARDNNLDPELGFAYVGLARVYRGKGDYAQALNYNNLALSIAGTAGDDSLKVTAFNSMGKTYSYRNEKLLAFRNFLEALDAAELSKRDDLLRLAYTNLSDFYLLIEEYDKAIDYEVKITAIDQKNGDRFNLLEDYNNTGKLFSIKKQTDLALAMYEKSIALADSLHDTQYKLNSYVGITNMYLNNDNLQMGFNYLNSHPEVREFFTQAGIAFYLDEGYGSIYAQMGKFDSAYFFLKKAEPEIEQKATTFNKYDFYRQFGDFYKMKGDYKTSIGYYQRARVIGEETKDLNILETCAQNLDTLYTRTGDFKTAYLYNTKYNQYKDSIRSLAKETDLLKLEVDNGNRRRERLLKEQDENMQRRHNIQYMGFTAGLACLFIVLVMMGFFMVSPRTIRALGFFSFIFLFEFIILLADKEIHELTHGEPWKVLLIKVFLAAILLPLHHWLEHTVIHYLNSRRKIAAPGISFFGKRPKKEGVVADPAA